MRITFEEAVQALPVLQSFNSQENIDDQHERKKEELRELYHDTPREYLKQTTKIEITETEGSKWRRSRSDHPHQNESAYMVSQTMRTHETEEDFVRRLGANNLGALDLDGNEIYKDAVIKHVDQLVSGGLEQSEVLDKLNLKVFNILAVEDGINQESIDNAQSEIKSVALERLQRKNSASLTSSEFSSPQF